ncbi:leucine-rich repeat protein [Peptostreptococcus faecalis]|uniref:leucine-rich repeat protein n=1 Tax=Peptostreptococcus faecalis TaxID=2045015 RepID=UPI000C7E7D9E|nr:leucine-rich repeat protein [Peptostreptococcus faecalis]
MFKKILTTFLSCAIVTAIIPLESIAIVQDNINEQLIEQEVKSIESELEFDKENGAITKYIGNSKKVIIPDKIDNVEVKKIGPSAFSKNLEVEEIHLNEGLEIIGRQAFSSAKNLKKIEFSSTVKSIEEGAFISTSLDEVILNEGLESIERLAFSNITTLKSIRLPDSLKKIENQVFMKDINLNSEMYFGKNLEKVNNSLFKSAGDISEYKIASDGADLVIYDEVFTKNINYLKLPQNRLLKIASRAFLNTDKVVLDAGEIKVENINEIENELKKKVKVYSGFIVPIKDDYLNKEDLFVSTEIEWNLENLDLSKKSLEVEGKFKSIPDSEYEKYNLLGSRESTEKNLDRHTIKATLLLNNEAHDKWNEDDFIYDEFSYGISSGGKYFGIKGFSDKGMKKINNNKNLVIPGEVQIEEGGVVKTKKIEGIGRSAFSDKGIETVAFPSAEGRKKEFIIDMSAFNNNKIEKISIPSYVKAIDSFAFKKNRIKNIYIPGSVLKIGNEAFSENEIDNLEISDDVDSIQIDNYCFANNKIKEVHLPYSIFKLKEYVFINNPGVEKIEGKDNVGQVNLYTRNPKHLHTSSYIYPSEYQKFVLIGGDVNREELHTAIKEANNLDSREYNKESWDNFNLELIEIKEIFKNENSSQEDINRAKIRLANSINTLEGIAVNKKALREKINEIEKLNKELYTASSWKILNKEILTAKEIIEDQNATQEDVSMSVKGIEKAMKNLEISEEMKYDAEDFLFEGSIILGFSEKGEKKSKINKDLILPDRNKNGDEITEIGAKAFEVTEGVIMGNDIVESPNGLKSVKIPESVTKIGDSSFRYNSFETVILPEKLKEIGAVAFNGNQLIEVSIPDSVTAMGDGVFSLNKLKKIKFSKGMDKIPNGICSRNIFLEHIDIPNGIKVVGESAFVGAPLKEINIPKTVVEIQKKAFSAHRAEELVIPGNVKKIGKFAFEENVKFRYTTSLILEEGIEIIENSAFKSLLLKEVKIPKTLKELGKEAFKNNLDENKNEIVVKLITNNDKHLTLFEESKYHKIFYVEESIDTTLPSYPSNPSYPLEKVIMNERIAGKDRYETAVKVSSKYFKQSENVILVSNEKFSDSMVSANISKKLNAPILITNKNSIPKSTVEEMRRLKSKKVIMVGGVNTISEDVEKIIKENKLDVERISGRDRYETSIKIAQKYNNDAKDIYIVNGENIVDGLSVSNLSTKFGRPIILAKNSEISKEVIEYIFTNKIQKAVIAGGENSVGKEVKGYLSKYCTVNRIAGKDRYETSLKVAIEAYENPSKIFVANGDNIIDSLVIGSVVSNESTPMILVNSKNYNDIKTWIDKSKISKIIFIGGENSISKDLEKKLLN